MSNGSDNFSLKIINDIYKCMIKFVQMYNEQSDDNWFIYLHVSLKLCHSHLFGDSTLSSPQREHDHSHIMSESNIYTQWDYFPCTHQSLLIGWRIHYFQISDLLPNNAWPSDLSWLLNLPWLWNGLSVDICEFLWECWPYWSNIPRVLEKLDCSYVLDINYVSDRILQMTYLFFGGLHNDLCMAHPGIQSIVNYVHCFLGGICRHH